ncbi:TetR/AcrR family transcriptional regulator [Myceligenerans indicum]|uniref:Helix-turn-helix transcriptional regulator n=1 Tax=Myceligenerans indicum TaxID=2593663 RepID=A0ABS1LNQ8_9MICO|nr:TetR/AcrR family transcriptional regulator [Myceligenerans indicum]MBL0887418.1 helix-turn-helix transcriptional regulator [Myceligenerans indicum]
MQPTDPEATSKRLTRRRAETRRRLIDAAYEVFAEVGIRDAPVELICERAGFTRGAFYSNFGSKEEIFLAMYEIQMSSRAERLAAGAEAALRAVGTPGPRGAGKAVALIAAQFVEGLGDDVRWYPVFAEFRAQALRRSELRAPTAAAEARFEATLAHALQQAARALGLRFTVNENDLALVVRSMYEAMLTRMLLREVTDGGAEEMARSLTELMLGVSAPASAGPGPADRERRR